MSSQSKRKGSEWERDLEEYLNSQGLKARRLPRAGSKDIGDISVSSNGVALNHRILDVIFEAKNVRDAWGSMAQYLREADVEAENYSEKYDIPTIGVVATKTRQAGPGAGRIVMTVDTFIDLLRWAGVV